MDDTEFENYLINLLISIFPDDEDLSGLRVMAKIDSGPGCSNLDIFTRLRVCGYYLHPAVPNTTSVSQKTYRTVVFSNQYIKRNCSILQVTGSVTRKKRLLIFRWLACSFLGRSMIKQAAPTRRCLKRNSIKKNA